MPLTMNITLRTVNFMHNHLFCLTSVPSPLYHVISSVASCVRFLYSA